VAKKDAAAKVILHALAGTKKGMDACRLVEALFHGGKRVVVFAGDAGRAAIFNDYLWTFAQHAFVPHVIWSGGEVEEPVVIVPGALANPIGADTLVILDRLADPAQATGFSEVHDFVGQAAEDHGKREAWAGAGFAVKEVRGVSSGRSRAS
jgi:DNA polymerase IIIc chi subunit